MKVAHFNAQGLKTKFNELTDFIISKDIDMCAITETWLSSEIEDAEFLPEKYQVVFKRGKPMQRRGTATRTQS